MSSKIKYERISSEEQNDEKSLLNHNDDLTDIEEIDEYNDEDNNNIILMAKDNSLGKSIATIRHEVLVPISRPPTKPRDGIYGVIFVAHFIIVVILSFIDKQRHPLKLLFKLYSNAGSWASLMMIITLIGSFVGSNLIFIISNESYRKILLLNGLTLSIIFQICLGNILLLMHSSYSLLGIILLFSAFIDSFRYKEAKSSISFTCALIQLSIDICKMYGINLFIACACVVILQTCLLLWWGVFFVGVLSEVTAGYKSYLLIIMALSFYWIYQFFHAFISYVTGGCILWYFLREDNEELNSSKRVLLLMQCAVSTSFGSLCKGSIYSPFAQVILVLNNWSNSRINPASTCFSGKNLIRCITSPFMDYSLKFNRLAFCLIATYGKTFCKSAEEQAYNHPETIRIAIEDNTTYTLNATATFISGFVALLFSLLSDKNEGSSWPLFFLVNFYLAYSGLSICMHTYKGAVDALIVAFAAKPERFATENQIIFLRFLRYTESALR